MNETNPSDETRDAPSTVSHAQATASRDVSPNHQIAKSTNPRSREMLGGPILGVAAFLIAAFLLGWGLISLLNIQIDGAVQDGAASDLVSRFDTEAVYIVQRDMLLGVNQDANAVMFYPDYDALPAGTPNRRYIPRVADYLADPGSEKYKDTLGVVAAGTRIRFERLAEEPTNRQARFLVNTLILDGEHEGIHARGMFFETQTPGDEGQRVVSPRVDLFRLADASGAEGEDGEPAAADEPIQSPVGPPDEGAD